MFILLYTNIYFFFMFFILLSIVYYVCFILYSHLFSLLSPPPFSLNTYICMFHFYFVSYYSLSVYYLQLLPRRAKKMEKTTPHEQPRPTANKEDSPGVTWEVTFLYNYFLFHCILCLFYFILTFIFSSIPPPSPLIHTYACFIFICFILLTLCLLLAAAAETSKEDGEDNAPGAARPTANKEDTLGATW